MKSLRQIEREYNAIIAKGESEPALSDKNGSINVYTCPNAHVIKTINISRGATPMILSCGVCGADAHSSFHKDTRPDIEVSHEFYRPDLRYVMKKLRRVPSMLEHVLMGGLMIRKIVKK